MSNNVNVNPVVIDTFGSDVVISSTPVTVSSIVMEGASAGDTATFIVDPSHGTTEVLRLSNAASGATAPWKPAIPFTFQNGLVFDDSASSLATGDYIYIFLA